MTVRHERGDFVLTDDSAVVNVRMMHQWLSTRAYWALGRELDVVARSIANSRCYTILQSGVPVGFARIVTDNATFAWICDVFIDESVRGQGLGHWLMQSIVDDLTAEGLPRLVLATRDAHGVYSDVGFVPLEFPDRWMEIDRRPQKHDIATTQV